MPQVESEITQLSEYVYNHIKLIDSPIIVEIGTKFGGTLFIWSSINTTGLNVSIDYSDGGIHGGISNVDMDIRDKSFSEKYSNVCFIRGDSHLIETEKKLDRLIGKRSIDFLFLDGDHSYNGIKQDFEMYTPYVKSGGIVGFHDINDSERHRNRNVYVSKFWNEIKDSYNYIEFNDKQDWAGIGVLNYK
jgi:cephalosporin hydroxylase